MNNDDINDYLPSILNPRAVRKQKNVNLNLTQNSIVSRCSLSLKKRNGNYVKKALHRTFPPGKENVQNNNNTIENFTKQLNKNQSHEHISIDFSLSPEPTYYVNDRAAGKENVKNVLNSPSLQKSGKSQRRKTVYETSIGFSAVEDIHTEKEDFESSPTICFEYELPVKDNHDNIELRNNDGSLTVESSATELEDIQLNDTTSEVTTRPIVAVAFGVMDCETLNISTKNSNIKNIVISRMDTAMNVECEVIESSQISVENNTAEVISISSDDDEPPPPKKPTVAVNLEFKNITEKLTENESSKVLIKE